MFRFDSLQHQHQTFSQRNFACFLVLRLVILNPNQPPFEIDLRHFRFGTPKDSVAFPASKNNDAHPCIQSVGLVPFWDYAQAFIAGSGRYIVLVENSIVCPYHVSRFSLDDGHVLDGPAVHPQPCLEVRVRNGQIEVRKPLAKGSLEPLRSKLHELGEAEWERRRQSAGHELARAAAAKVRNFVEIHTTWRI